MNKQKKDILTKEMLEELMDKNNWVDYDGSVFVLLESAEGDADRYGDLVYKARAVRIGDDFTVDDEGDWKVPAYQVLWYPKEDWHPEQDPYSDPNDDSDACDWDHPYDVQALDYTVWLLQ